MSDPGGQASLVDALPHDLGALCQAILGLLLHADWCTSYGLDASHFGPGARTTLPLEQRLRRIAESDPVHSTRYGSLPCVRPAPAATTR